MTDFSNKQTIARHYTVSGRVQGVGFRFWTVKTANRLCIQGWVRNTPKGDVEILAQGNIEKLSALEALLWKGPIISNVHSVLCAASPETEIINGFSVRY